MRLLRLNIKGMVQGVGFRPFVYRLARELGLVGWVGNTAQGVEIEIEGRERTLRSFLDRLLKESPFPAGIQDVSEKYGSLRGYSDFEIHASRGGKKTAWVLPDLATCDACLKEVLDPHNRRYRYPFTNCTHCGPRFSIIQSLPYDRAHTTMKNFAMCAACRREYEDPSDRRFHAQPNACPECGPALELWDGKGRVMAQGEEALGLAVASLKQGSLVALKGLGGFQILGDARNESVVQLLRERKARPEKPFALMFPGWEEVRRHTRPTAVEREWLFSPQAPIVLLEKRKDLLAPGVAPNNPYLGVMLPYTPLHHLLLKDLGIPLLATSGNRAEEPICTREQEALKRLQGIVDLFLVHNRPIARHVDDSILKVVGEREMLLRRARGFAPLPLSLSRKSPPWLALGGHLKNTVAFLWEEQALLSQHLGNLDTPEAKEAFENMLGDFQNFYEREAAGVLCDFHPDYASTRFAECSGKKMIRVQHHHAHVVAAMVEHGLEGPALGIAWDGAGDGGDGTLWGGEFLTCTAKAFQRMAHFKTFPLPGGELAAREPRRAALGLMYALIGEDVFAAGELAFLSTWTGLQAGLLKKALRQGIITPHSSSVGRLFDAVASLLGIRQFSSFEGQAAMELEFAALRGEDQRPLPFEIRKEGTLLIVDWGPMILTLIHQMRKNLPTENLARKFHNTLAEAALAVAERVGEKQVVLSGGCFQNKLLSELVIARLREKGFCPYWHRLIPPNDGGIALGQAAIGSALLGDQAKCV